MIPVFSLERQNRKIEKEISKAIKEVIARGVFILGPKVEEFEREFAKYIGVKYAVGVASGTDALSLSLLAVGVEPGDEVILPANSYPTAFAVTVVGAVPKLVDIDPVTFNIDPEKIPAAITSKTKAIIPVHLYGRPADLEKIKDMKIRDKKNIYIIEDCAQAHGAEVSSQWSVVSGQKPTTDNRQPTTFWRKVGSLGDIGCFSFYPTKNLGCFGDGGMVVTNNKEIYGKVKLFRMYGERKRYESVLLGRNSRLDEIQAAILLVKLKYLNQWNERRRAIAELYRVQSAKCKVQSYSSKFKAINLQPTTYLPRRPASPELQRGEQAGNLQPNTRHVYHLFVIRAKERDKLKKYLEEKGIGTGVHYPTPVHLVPSFAYLGYKKGDFPEAERASREILSLPMWPELKDREIKKVVEAMSQFYTTA